MAIGPAIATAHLWVRVMLVAFAWTLGLAQAPALTPYQIKAGFIYNIALSTKWPGVEPEDASPLIFGILGDDPSEGAFASLDGNEVGKRKLSIKKYSSLAEARDCHLLFINSTEKDTLLKASVELKDLPILTITDMALTPALRGMVHFVIEKERVRFEVNVSAAERVKLKISSQVLKIAKLRRDGPPRKEKE